MFGSKPVYPGDLAFPGFREREAKAFGEALSASLMPAPKENDPEWKAIVAHYKLPQPVKHDHVLAKVTLPTGWTLVPSKHDNRRMVIMDHEGKVVGGSFLKNTGYDYYGSLYFEKDRLVELGVLKPEPVKPAPEL